MEDHEEGIEERVIILPYTWDGLRHEATAEDLHAQQSKDENEQKEKKEDIHELVDDWCYDVHYYPHVTKRSDQTSYTQDSKCTEDSDRSKGRKIWASNWNFHQTDCDNSSVEQIHDIREEGNAICENFESEVYDKHDGEGKIDARVWLLVSADESRKRHEGSVGNHD